MKPFVVLSTVATTECVPRGYALEAKTYLTRDGRVLTFSVPLENSGRCLLAPSLNTPSTPGGCALCVNGYIIGPRPCSLDGSRTCMPNACAPERKATDYARVS